MNSHRILPAMLLAAVTAFRAHPAHSQQSAAESLIAAAESMKHSVTRLMCSSDVRTSTPEVLGSAFFISSAGTFLTAGHVFAEVQGRPDFCRFAAVAVPLDQWNPQVREEFHAWFEFRPSDCTIDNDLDVARCRTIENLSLPRKGMTFVVRAAQFRWNTPPDGSEVASMGFPLGVRDPMTSRAIVSTSRIVWSEGKPHPELLLDRPSSPGSSGSPVFLSDGRVVGIVIGTGTGETSGLTLARPSESLKQLLAGGSE